MHKKQILKKKLPNRKQAKSEYNKNIKSRKMINILVFDYCPILGFSFYTTQIKV